MAVQLVRFEMIFSNKKELLELYNAINGTDYTNPVDLVVNTLENAIYMGMHNDVSFLIDKRLNLYEHQSTYNPNLSLSDTFQVKDEELQLWLKAAMLNINKGHNKKLLDACRILKDYAEYTALVRE